MLLQIICDRGSRPPRPEEPEILEHGLDDSMWQLITTCWDQDPQQRCDAGHIFENLDGSEDDEPDSPLSDQSSTYASSDEEFYDLPPSTDSSTATTSASRLSKSKVLQLWAPSTSPESVPVIEPPSTPQFKTAISDSGSSSTTRSEAVVLNRPEDQLRGVAKHFLEREVVTLQKSIMWRSARQKEIDNLERMLETEQPSAEEKKAWKARLTELKKQQKVGRWGNLGPYLDMLCEAV